MYADSRHSHSMNTYTLRAYNPFISTRPIRNTDDRMQQMLKHTVWPGIAYAAHIYRQPYDRFNVTVPQMHISRASTVYGMLLPNIFLDNTHFLKPVHRIAFRNEMKQQ